MNLRYMYKKDRAKREKNFHLKKTHKNLTSCVLGLQYFSKFCPPHFYQWGGQRFMGGGQNILLPPPLF